MEEIKEENEVVIDQGQPSAAPGLDELRDENEKLKNEIRLGRARDEMTGRLVKAGAWSPGLMLSAVGGELQFDEDGVLVNGAAIVEKLKRDFPESFAGGVRPAAIDGGAGSRRLSSLTKEALAKMSPAEIARLDWEDVRRVLSGE